MQQTRRHTKILICPKGCSAELRGGKAMRLFLGQNTQITNSDLRPDGQAARIASIKARILAGSFTPGALSTPEETSTCFAPVN